MQPGTPPTLPVVTDRVVVAASIDHPALPTVDSRVRWPDGSGVVAAISSGALVLLSLDPQDPPSWSNETGLSAIVEAGMHHVAVAPVIVDELVVAVVTFGCLHDRPVWASDELALLGSSPSTPAPAWPTG